MSHYIGQRNSTEWKRGSGEHIFYGCICTNLASATIPCYYPTTPPPWAYRPSFWIIIYLCSRKLGTANKKAGVRASNSQPREKPEVNPHSQSGNALSRNSGDRSSETRNCAHRFHNVTLDSAAIQLSWVWSRTDPEPYVGTQDCQESQRQKYHPGYTRQVHMFWFFIFAKSVTFCFQIYYKLFNKPL